MLVAHSERATIRVGDTFLKIDADGRRLDREVAAMGLAPLPTPPVLWHRPPVLALACVPGHALGRLGVEATAPAAAWSAAGAEIRRLHDAPLPPWPAKAPADPAVRARLDRECAWLVESGTLPAAVVERNRRICEASFRPWQPVFAHGDLQIAHVFVEETTVTGVIDWSEAGPGDPLADLATLTLGHEGRLADVLVGYGADVDPDVIRALWSRRCLTAIRWLVQHGFDPALPGCEVDVLLSRM